MGITKADLDAQRAMLARGEAKRRAAKQAEDRERLRDHFAAAALTGFIRGLPSDSIFHLGLLAKQSYEVADAMLRERGNHIADAGKMVETSGKTRKSTGVADAFATAAAASMGCDVLVYANLDAAPAARAEASVKEPMVHATGEPGGEPESTIGTGKQPAPPSVETDGFSPGSRSGQINRSPERQSPDRECGESSLRDVPQPDNGRAAGGPEHHISETQIDALECVVEGGRIVGMSVYGHLRSLLVRLRPEWESDRPKPISDERLAALEELSALDQELELKHGIQGNPMIKPQVNNHPESYAQTDEKRVLYDTKSPRNGALSGCETVPDPDSRVWETPCTPQPQRTPTQGSVHGEGSVPRSGTENEPVAWAVIEGEWYHRVYLNRHVSEEFAGKMNEVSSRPWTVVPLYRHPQPTLTDEERKAIDLAADWLSGVDMPIAACSRVAPAAETLRNLLERLA